MTVLLVSPGSADLVLGEPWLIAVAVLDTVTGAASSETVTVTVTPPSGPAETPTVETGPSGAVAVYLPLAAGRYTAAASTASQGTARFAAYVTGGSAVPDLDAVKTYLRIPVEDETQDVDVADALAAEAAAQRSVCQVPAAYPDDLGQALKRRVARNLALRGLPIMVLQGDAESGSLVPPGRDAEVRRLEGPFRLGRVRAR